jgi:hypothetical protein
MTESLRPHYEQKKKNILQRITPLLNIFGFTDFEFIQEFQGDNEREVPNETLRIGTTYIGCTSNGEYATFLEAVNYVWVKSYNKHFSIGTFEKQTLKYIQRHWRENL